MRFGRLAARRPVGLADLAYYMGGTFDTPPATMPAPNVADWGMCANDEVGDCTLAAVVHQRMACAADLDLPTEAWPSDAKILSTYFSLTGGKDSGLVEADVLRKWNTDGLFGDRIAGYAPADHRDEEELQAVCATFKAVYCGIVVPGPAEQQFQAGEPWDLTGTSADRQVLGGHAVPMVGYNADGPVFVTWSKLQQATWRWTAVYLEEAWSVITSEDSRKLDLATLQADLARLERAA